LRYRGKHQRLLHVALWIMLVVPPYPDFLCRDAARCKLKLNPVLSLFEMAEYLLYFVEGFLGIATLSAAILKNFLQRCHPILPVVRPPRLANYRVYPCDAPSLVVVARGRRRGGQGRAVRV
jgi:hypothetical protein